MNNHFFQFPLCLLSTVEDVRAGLDHIISFACVDVGKKRWEKLSPDQRQAWRSGLPDPTTSARAVNLSDDQELAAVVGYFFFGFTTQDIKRSLSAYAQLDRFIKEFESKYGPDVLVRIRADWLFEIRGNKGMAYKEFAVLAAIYSKIGATQRPVLITRDEIWRRAHGFKSGRVFEAEMNRGRKPFLTARQVRSIIERLHSRNFFARITFGRRQTYYSNRLNAKELADQIFTAKTQRSRARQARICADAELTARVRAARRKLAGSVATKVATDAPL